MPAEIRAMCVEATPKPMPRLALPRATVEYDNATDERRQYHETADQARQRWAEEHGYKDFDAVMQRGIQAVGRGLKSTASAPLKDVTVKDPQLIARALGRLPTMRPDYDRESEELA